jgi:hypothetical protein
MMRSEEEIRSILGKGEKIQKEEVLPEEEIQREYPKDSPSGRN